MKKQTVLQFVTLIAAAVFLFAAYSHIVGTGSVFKGHSDSEVARAKVIRAGCGARPLTPCRKSTGPMLSARGR